MVCLLSSRLPAACLHPSSRLRTEYWPQYWFLRYWGFLSLLKIANVLTHRQTWSLFHCRQLWAGRDLKDHSPSPCQGQRHLPLDQCWGPQTLLPSLELFDVNILFFIHSCCRLLLWTIFPIQSNFRECNWLITINLDLISAVFGQCSQARGGIPGGVQLSWTPLWVPSSSGHSHDWYYLCVYLNHCNKPWSRSVISSLIL